MDLSEFVYFVTMFNVALLVMNIALLRIALSVRSSAMQPRDQSNDTQHAGGDR